MLRSILFASTMLPFAAAAGRGRRGAADARARARAGAGASPAVLAAGCEVEEARGPARGARALFAENPTLSGGLGRRRSRQDRSDPARGAVELVQPIELGGRRGARVAAADAGSAAATRRQRRASCDGSRPRWRGRSCAGCTRPSASAGPAAEETAARSAHALERRHQAGDVPVLEVNLARTARARATAEVRAARRWAWPPRASWQPARPAGRRPARAGGRSAPAAALRPGPAAPAGGETARRCGRCGPRPGRRRPTRRWAAPSGGRGSASARRTSARGARTSCSAPCPSTLPLFQRGQGLRASAAARARRLALQAEAARRSAAAAVRAAFGAHEERLAAVRALEEALPLVQDNEELAAQELRGRVSSSLAEWMVVRREALETRVGTCRPPARGGRGRDRAGAGGGGVAMTGGRGRWLRLLRRRPGRSVAAPAAAARQDHDEPRRGATAQTRTSGASTRRSRRGAGPAAGGSRDGAGSAGHDHQGGEPGGRRRRHVAGRAAGEPGRLRRGGRPGQRAGGAGCAPAPATWSRRARCWPRSTASSWARRAPPRSPPGPGPSWPRQALERKRRLVAERVLPERELEEAQAEARAAEAELRAARTTLQALGAAAARGDERRAPASPCARRSPARCSSGTPPAGRWSIPDQPLFRDRRPRRRCG